MSLGKRLRDLRNERGYSRPVVAKALGLQYQTYVNYENDQREVGHDVLCKMADYYGVTTDYLLGMSNVVNPFAVFGSEKIRVPVLGRVPAGVPIEAVEDILGWEDLSVKDYDPSHRYFGLTVVGDSMSPKYLDGDTVIVQSAADSESGRDVIAMVNGNDATLKKLIKYENGSISLIAFNQAYESVTYTKEQIASMPITIMGFVRELRRSV